MSHYAKRTIRGSPMWMAPEVLSGRHGVASYGRSADVYSLTIVCWQILSLEYLYPGMKMIKINQGVMNGTLRPEIPKQWPMKLKNIVKRGWNQDPQNRPSAKELRDVLAKTCTTFFVN